MVRVYRTKRGVSKLDLSQLRPGPEAELIRTIVASNLDLQATSPLSSSQGFPVVGTDESGKGDYFGPLVGAAVWVDEALARTLTAAGVADSKLLSDARNLAVSDEIMRICSGQAVVIEIGPAKYNDLYERFTAEGKNLNILLGWVHAKAIEEILARAHCSVVVADQFADESVIIGKLQERGQQVKLIQTPHGERNIAVAAASILARARFLRRLGQLSDEYGFDLPKGISSQVVHVARSLVAQHGPEILRHVAKLHFRTTAAAMA